MKRKKKKEFPLTAFLVVLVSVLIVILCAVVGMFLNESNREYEQAQRESIQMETDQIHASETNTETEMTTENQAKGQTDVSKEQEIQSENETEPETVTDTENTTESEEGIIDITVESEAETEVDKLVVAIDPGHQGSWVDMSDKEPNAPGSTVMKTKATTGTQGRFSGKKEYELNLEVSLLLRTELEARGYEVILTREDHDTAISNAERALLAYEQGGDIYVRIHANGADDAGVDGALAMVPSPQNEYVGYLAEDSYLLGQCILEAYCSRASFNSLGIQYYDDMTGINWSKLPVMILEMGFMTNESDDLRMADPDVQVLMAEGIADGIDAYFEQKGMKTEEASADDQAKIDTALEILGESYVYPALEAGETWAVSMKDLQTGAYGSLNGDVPMKAASLIKVFIMATIYDRVCYPSSADRYIAYPESYEGELKQLITDMITVSDNTAANTLVRNLGGGDAQAGMAVVNQFCEENGYTSTYMGRLFLEENPGGDNYTSANDCLALLESISEGTCVNAEASAKMMAYLEQQTRRSKIPSGLSQTGVSVANKTGELYGEYGDFVENDIAVIRENDSDFVLCILSRNVSDNGTASAKVAEMARVAYGEAR